MGIFLPEERKEIMKKTLAMILALVMVSALCGMLFVSAEDVNLALNKEVANAEINGDNANYCAKLTDGVIADEISTENGKWFGYWYNGDAAPDVIAQKSNTEENGIAIPTIDLGAATELSSVRMHIVDKSDWGIGAPDSATAQVSNDGVSFTDVATVSEFESGVTWVEFDLSGQTAQYVRLSVDLGSSWFFLDEIEIYGTAAAGGDEPSDEPSTEPSEPAKTYEDTLVKGEDGNYTCEVPYGYTWTVNYVDGTIVGEDVTICTTQTAYEACNPNWAITIYAEKQADGSYVALQDAIETPGSAANAGITIGENQIAIVVHSAASNPDPDKDGKTYANWKSKVVAMAVKTGDVFTVNEDMTSVYAVIPGAENEPIESTPAGSEPPKTGDAGILAFAVLGVIAIAGAAVVIKARG